MEIERFVVDQHEPHAIVREEDVQLVLSASLDPTPPRESLEALERAAASAAGHTPGSVVVRGGRPLLMLAIIHDVDRDPSWREDWIVAATVAVLREASWRGLTRVAMPLLGTVHGGLAPARAAALLVAALERPGVAYPGTLWLQGAEPAIVEWLRRRLH